VTSIRTVSSLTLERAIVDEFAASMSSIVQSSTKSLVFTMIPYALSQSLEFLILALGFWYGSRLVASGEYSSEQFFVVFIAVVFGGQAAGQFFGYSTSITKAKAAANYILWLRSIQPQIGENASNSGRGPSGEGALALEKVSFRYAQRPAARVLDGIDIQIQPGQSVAFVGPSGCGKSTLVALLERFYDPTSGRITLGGDDIAALSPRAYRSYMSLVQQEPPLYQGSVRENVALGLDHEPADDDVREALRQANALELVASLPEGLDTPCGAKGTQFSGGQKQRLAVARALIRKPRLLLLDEATSALDTTSEKMVQRALDEAASGRTTVAVAHRLSTIKHASVIFVMAHGRIVEVGTHEELQALGGRYYAMCLAQSLDQA
jgi:ATP-binding cassette subfamily B (MDR/TAP) protein 1